MRHMNESKEANVNEFALSMRLGNHGMRRPEHVAEALRNVAIVVETQVDLEELRVVLSGPVRDVNGNSVGRWTVTP